MSKPDSLDGLFRPRSVAVIGASRREHSIGLQILRNLVEFGFSGPVYPVNPAGGSVHSIRAYRHLSAISGPVDLAVIVVPRDAVLPVIEQCGRKGVRGVVVITAGFKETGEEGSRLEDRLRRRVAHWGMRMVGPNCMGIVNSEPGVRLNATFAATPPRPGRVGLISQSGALGEAILTDAAQGGLGVSMFVSLGNRTDVTSNDLLEYWENDPGIQAVLIYLESFGDPGRFTRLARKVTRRKPILAVKAGRTEAGARAASSHTGSIVGHDIATEALLEQSGVLRVSTLEEMFVQAAALVRQPVPTGNRIAIVTNAGGPAILCTDACIGRGLRLATLGAATRRSLRKALPPEASVGNPVDMIASAGADAYRAVLDRVRRDPAVDGVIAIFVSPIMIDAFEVARAIAESADGSKPVLSVFMGKQRSAEGIRELRNHRVPVYRFPDQAASGMAALDRYRELREAPRGRPVRFRVDSTAASRIIARARRQGRAALSSEETRELLEAYGFPMVPSRATSTIEEALNAAAEFGYPVVVKVASERIDHKSDVGGVRLDLRDADELREAHADLTKRLRRRDPHLRIEVQPMVTGGREVILGMKRDPQFGPLLMFGLGGVFVEIMRDVSVRVHPLTDQDARSMIRRIRGRPLLEGARGEKPVDQKMLERCLLRLSQLVGDLEAELEELDLNPLIVTDRADRSFVVDARVALRPAGPGRQARSKKDRAGRRPV